LAQHASGYQAILNTLSAIGADDWRKKIIDYLKDPSKKVERRVRFQATKYVLLGDELYYRTIDGLLLKCLGDDEAKSLMGEIHEGVCGAHQSAFKMKWMIRETGIIGRIYSRIALNISNDVRNLAIFKGHPRGL